MDDYKGVLLHTMDYQTPKQIVDLIENNEMFTGDATNDRRKKRILVVGCGNSAVEIAGTYNLRSLSLSLSLLCPFTFGAFACGGRVCSVRSLSLPCFLSGASHGKVKPSLFSPSQRNPTALRDLQNPTKNKKTTKNR